MQKIKQTVHTIILYVLTVVLVGGVPMSAVHADRSPACVEALHNGKQWYTDPESGACVKKVVTPKPKPAPSESPAPTESPAPEESASPSPSPEASAQPAAGDTNSTTNNTDITSETNVDNDTDVTTGVDSTATSGDSTVRGNQSSGSANTGDAAAVATVVNSVHSTVDGGTGIAHFTADIHGNVVGDITLGSTIDGLNATSNVNYDGKTNVNNDTSLTNDINLTAQSGDASVKGNESVGSATTGSANTVADVLNLINTIIAANKSFIGTINIYGDLNGDILISPEFIPQLLASNANSTYKSDLALATNINDDQSIVNNVNLSATSGDASVKGNESTGSAASGDTKTNLTILNLTGHEVNAANSLLVFVNVLGTWVGMILDAPGATAAAFGGGVIESNVAAANETNIANKAGITNNIDLASTSGDASVTGNKSQGSAASGDATASANIANVSSSTFKLSDWFGVVYINVFGSWDGWFLKDTQAGTLTPLGGDAIPEAAVSVASSPVSQPQFGFIPGGSNRGAPIANLAAASSGAEDPDYQSAVLASAIAKDVEDKKSPQILQQTKSPREDPFSIIMMVTGFGVASVSGLVWLARRFF